MGSYNKDVYPPIGAIGISQFDHQKDKDGYFKQVADARQLQARFTKETGIDVVSRVAKLVAEVSGLPVRIAQEGDRKYFAGLLRMINSSALIHADFAPYDGPAWEIGRIESQITWNILLSRVEGGESIIYDRAWRGEPDNKTFKKAPPSYGYTPLMVENHPFKVLQPMLGDLTFFNSRNFHEVKLIDRPDAETRFTMSSFMGYLDSDAGGPTIIMWS
jgi:hypothetical protein